MKRHCAWCEKVIEPGKQIEPGETVSHGICDNCFEKVAAEIAEAVQPDHIVEVR